MPRNPGGLADGDGQAPGYRPSPQVKCASASIGVRAGSGDRTGEGREHAFEEALDDDIGDDLLGLIFAACHPVLPTEARLALTLRLVGGLTTAEIARAFPFAERRSAQRIVRAKRRTSGGERALRGSRGGWARERVWSSALEVIYLIFNEGYSATAGSDLLQAAALRKKRCGLGRILAQARSRRGGRSRAGGADGDPGVALWRGSTRRAAHAVADQNRGRWDQLLMRRGLAALARAEALGDARGQYVLQAAIAACHARAASGRQRRTGLASPRFTPNCPNGRRRRWSNSTVRLPWRWPKVRRPGLDIADRLTSEPVLQEYHLLPAIRGDLLFKLGRFAEAETALELAASLTRNERERTLLLSGPIECREKLAS